MTWFTWFAWICVIPMLCGDLLDVYFASQFSISDDIMLVQILAELWQTFPFMHTSDSEEESYNERTALVASEIPPVPSYLEEPDQPLPSDMEPKRVGVNWTASNCGPSCALLTLLKHLKLVLRQMYSHRRGYLDFHYGCMFLEFVTVTTAFHQSSLSDIW